MGVFQLGRIYLDMLNVYKVLSENISTAIALNGMCVCGCTCVVFTYITFVQEN